MPTFQPKKTGLQLFVGDVFHQHRSVHVLFVVIVLQGLDTCGLFEQMLHPYGKELPRSTPASSGQDASLAATMFHKIITVLTHYRPIVLELI